MPTVLVADDDPDNLAIARTVLEGAGYAVLTAADGREAVERMAGGKPEVVLLDLSMPKVSGWEAVRQMRRLPEGRCIPIVAFTAHALKGEGDKALAAGCDDVLTKPCLPRDIAAKVGEWMRKRRAVDGPEREKGDAC